LFLFGSIFIEFGPIFLRAWGFGNFLLALSFLFVSENFIRFFRFHLKRRNISIMRHFILSYRRRGSIYASFSWNFLILNGFFTFFLPIQFNAEEFYQIYYKFSSSFYETDFLANSKVIFSKIQNNDILENHWKNGSMIILENHWWFPSLLSVISFASKACKSIE